MIPFLDDFLGLCQKGAVTYNPKDHYFKKAKKENFAARSVYKLEEIDKRFHLFRSGQSVLDLGAAPGSWTQYAAKKIGKTGRILGIDLTEITIKVPEAIFVVGDINHVDISALANEHSLQTPFDVVLSDMAPKTTGIRITDQARSLELCQMALQSADKYLKVGGSFVAKFFHSDDFKTYQSELKRHFKRVEVVKPESTRAISKEIFFVGLNKT